MSSGLYFYIPMCHFYSTCASPLSLQMHIVSVFEHQVLSPECLAADVASVPLSAAAAWQSCVRDAE